MLWLLISPSLVVGLRGCLPSRRSLDLDLDLDRLPRSRLLRVRDRERERERFRSRDRSLFRSFDRDRLLSRDRLRDLFLSSALIDEFLNVGSSGFATMGATIGGFAIRAWWACRACSTVFAISLRELRNNLIFIPLISWLSRAIAWRASSSDEKAMKASPLSPPTICTPPSGIERLRKKRRISCEFASQGRF